ncbi:hypothetical protein, partial [Streptomyces roseolus]|uniref:hypothetical protein n=1 Tax=Streptomyces roseolus TaxID=67358 RepID=UPI003664EE5B
MRFHRPEVEGGWRPEPGANSDDGGHAAPRPDPQTVTRPDEQRQDAPADRGGRQDSEVRPSDRPRDLEDPEFLRVNEPGSPPPSEVPRLAEPEHAGHLGDESDTAPEHTPEPDRTVTPTDDEWSHLTPEQVGDRLAEVTGLRVFGFDLPNLDPDTVRDFARGVTDQLAANPHIDLRGVGIAPLEGGHFAQAQPRTDPVTGRIHTESITLDYRMASDPAYFRERLQLRVDQGRFHPSILTRPGYGAFLHEFGHAVDYAGGRAVHDTLEHALLQHFRATRPEGTIEDYLTWLQQLSGYSFSADGTLNPKEALPEAFFDVELNGKNASEPAKV